MLMRSTNKKMVLWAVCFLCIFTILHSSKLPVYAAGSQPTMAGFAPTEATVGETVIISGEHFTDATSVSFGGVAAISFTVDSDTQISALVPYGTSGDVAVTTTEGSATLGGFTYVTPTTYTFNHLQTGSIHEQDNWVSVPNNGSSDPHQIVSTAITGHDGTLSVRYSDSGAGIGARASRLNDANFSMPSFADVNGIYVVEFEMQFPYWGGNFGLGNDVNGNGEISGDELGFYLNGAGNNNTRSLISSHTTATQSGLSPPFSRYQIVIDRSANVGAGSASVWYKDLAADSAWSAIPSLQNVHLGFDSDSSGANNPANWNGIYFYSTGATQHIDNITFRKLSISERTLQFPETEVGSASVSRSVTLNNLHFSGNITATLTGDFEFDNGTQTLAGLADGSIMNVKFRPTDTGVRSGTLRLKADDADMADSIEIALTGNLETIAPIHNQTFYNLIEGYDLKETKTITVDRTSNGEITNLAVNLSGAHADNFLVMGPVNSTLNAGTDKTSFTIQAKDDLAAGTYTATVTVTGDNTIEESFTVTQVIDPFYTVTYNMNGADSGTVPIDGKQYEQGEVVIAMGNSGGLAKAGFLFGGWNTSADGRGTPYTPGTAFNMGTSNVNLYAQWAADPPAKPVIQSAVPGDSKVTLHWNTVQKADHYEIYRSTTTGIYGVPIDTVTGSVYSYDVTGLTNGTTYYFSIKATNPGGDNGFSNEVTTTPQVPAPGAPVIQAAAAGDKKVNLSWHPVQAAAGYEIFQSTSAGAYGAALDTVTGSVYSYEAIGLTNGTTYYFSIKATNPGGNSAYSNEVSATPQVPAPAAPVMQPALASDGEVILQWDVVDGATGYKLYQSTTAGTYGVPVQTVTDSIYEISGLTNGMTYYFAVKATNAGGDSELSNEVSATPQVPLPDAPVLQTATAGDTKVSLSWSTVSGAVGYKLYQSTTAETYGAPILTVTGSVYEVTGLTNGTTYYFAVKATNAGGDSGLSNELSAKPTGSSSVRSGGSSSLPENSGDGVEIIVNGKPEKAGRIVTTEVESRTVTTVIIDEEKLENKLAEETQGAVITIPVNASSEVVSGELNGQLVKNMEQKQAVLEIKTPQASYAIPAAQINIDVLSEQIGTSVALKDIKIRVEISVPSEAMMDTVKNAADTYRITLVANPITFTVKGSYGDKMVEVSDFNTYVERSIVLPDGADPNRVTTAVIIDEIGNVRHVPTKIENVGERYVAYINSLSNSTYSLVWNDKQFKDVEPHWAQETVNEMGSRMIVSGLNEDEFRPDQAVTRAEFAAILIRGLGLMLKNGDHPFNDVLGYEWYAEAVQGAYKYDLISGFEDGTFKPNEQLTREQAMKVIAQAMKLTGLKEKLTVQASSLDAYEDAGEISAWARQSAFDCLAAGIVSGRSDTILAPKAQVTRAEAAEMIQKLLQASELI